MIVEVQDLYKAYGSDFALHVPALRIEAGETFGLVGNNGAGKTTFLRLMLDLIQADRGCLLLNGRDVAAHEDWKSATGSFLDESFLLGFLTADEYFVFLGLLYGLSKPDIQKALEPYQSFFGNGVTGKKRKYIRDLSKGNAKKVGIVGAMFMNPSLLVLDEPFANLDPGSQIRLKALLRWQNETFGTTIVLSSHDLEHVTDVCGTVALLHDGQLVRRIVTSPETLPQLYAFFSEQISQDDRSGIRQIDLEL